jgi:endonuclease YncB( thermonuclease family)
MVNRVLSQRSRLFAKLALAVVFAAVILIQRYHPTAQPGRPDADADRSRYHQQTFKVVHVVDGDTLDLDAPDGDHDYTRVRLWGVDTPETKDPRKEVMYYGPEAAAFAREAAQGRMVQVGLEPFKPTRDKYGRLLAYVYLPDGKMLNEELIERGFGYADTRFEHVMKKRFEQLEKQAQREKRGLWKEVRPEQWPQWRRRQFDTTYNRD